MAVAVELLLVDVVDAVEELEPDVGSDFVAGLSPEVEPLGVVAGFELPDLASLR